MHTIWILDDDRSIRWVFEKALARENLPFASFASVAEARRALATETPAVVVSDIRMPGESGIDFLAELKQGYPDLPVIIMTAHSDLESAVAAFQGGAFEYLPKPFDVHEAVGLVQRALQSVRPAGEARTASAAVADMLGTAPAMQEVFRAIGRLSTSSATVLINGESGTGKELVARALHRHSPRAKAPFVAINTAAIPRDLLESELFGHERGAFTGAQATRMGRFEQAAGGTLFLDEIGDMPADLQTRLLRVLSDGHFYRVGGQQPVKADVRIIAATHQDLEERVKAGLFREDLFYRLNVIRLQLPPLRERRQDIPLLVEHFLQKTARELDLPPKTVSGAARDHLMNLPWHGNVRELENLCHWLTIMAPGQVITVTDLPQSQQVAPAAAWTALLDQQVALALSRGQTALWESYTAEFERTLIQQALRYTGGRRMEAAQLLGIGRNTLTRKIQDLELEAAPPDEEGKP